MDLEALPLREVRHGKFGVNEVDGRGGCLGYVFGGEPRFGDLARVLRDGVIVADDLRVGYIVPEGPGGKALSRASKKESFHFGLGFPGLRPGDVVECYERDLREFRPGAPATTPITHDYRTEVELGRAWVERPYLFERIDGRGGVVQPAGGVLSAGDRVRVVRGGQIVADVLRIVLLHGASGAEVPSIQGPGLLYVAFDGLEAGDLIVAYRVPEPRYREQRLGELGIDQVRLAGHGAVAVSGPLFTGPVRADTRARLVSGDEVVADGLPVLALLRDGRQVSEIDDEDSPFEIVVDRPSLPEGIVLETYSHVPS
ncbi:hypothetical protein ABGB12_00410 [Actinocorallia sp. B10E7]|uniref:hypothetical protein n=1 Tax=Actinocorallia sp. B10E7 TaxID=3153558 RepID=UPI00325D4D42